MAGSELETGAVREFRDGLSEHLMSDGPIAVAKHGLTVGYRIPTHPAVGGADGEALERRLKLRREAVPSEPSALAAFP